MLEQNLRHKLNHRLADGEPSDALVKLFAQPDLASQMQACQIADSLLQAPPYNLKPARPPVTPGSTPIKANQGQSR